MANLAIKGHATRGKEVIKILEMLGGKVYIKEIYKGEYPDRYYYINKNDGFIDTYFSEPVDTIIIYAFQTFTLEEFLEKFPYKIGDEVLNVQGTVMPCQIKGMYWDNDCVKYYCEGTIRKGECFDRTAEQLQPYEEQETMEEKGDKAKAPNLIGEDYYGKRFGYKSLNGYEFDCIKNNEIILKPKQSQYPKTYEECCEIMGIEYPVVGGKPDGLSASTYRINEIRPLIYLLICRDAYWKIAGEQMGLGKPWEPDFTDMKEMYYIFYKGYIEKGNQRHPDNHILAFPIIEMRDAFYENFKDLIEQCKKLL